MKNHQVKGRIFDIQRFSVHDGKGIRTIVFLKGCSLRCRWCCNPESQNFDFENMTIGGKTKLIGKDVTVEEVLVEVLKDRQYYRRSGGGITLSGGEVFVQSSFAYALLRESKERGISTAIESTANSNFDAIEMILPFLDTFLLDIKHMDAQKHKQGTGITNELILANAKKIADSGETELIIRIPVVPTFNDTNQEIADIARFAKSLKGVKQIHLLPYHRLGQDKYDGLNRPYTMRDILPPENQKMQELLKVAQDVSGLECRIGG